MKQLILLKKCFLLKNENIFPYNQKQFTVSDIQTNKQTNKQINKFF